MARSRTPIAPAALVAGLMAFVLTLLVGALAPSTASADEPYIKQVDISYDLGSPPADPARNLLDVYLPSQPSSGLRPFVVYVHGGGWRQGSKANPSMPDKARLFTSLGYGVVSISYRLSPMALDPDGSDPNRIKFPDHPDDVGEAIGWLDRNASSYGLDPDRMILMGHSAGAHLISLVSTDPRYAERHGVDMRQILGAIPLDTGAFDIEQSVLGGNPNQPSPLFMNAFGTPEENAATGSWALASPLTWADPSDPRHLFIAQAFPRRVDRQLSMATKLGQGPESVVGVPLSHAEINRAVGSPTDTTLTTSSITGFVEERLSAYRDPRAKIRKRPARVVRLGRKARSGKPKKRRVRFAFTGTENVSGFQCRLDKAAFRKCSSPRRYKVGRGRHSFRVRPLYPSGRPGNVKLVEFKAKPKRKSKNRR